MVAFKSVYDNSKEWLRSRLSLVIFAVTIITVLIISYASLLTTPRLWTDEDVSIDISRSFLTYGVLAPQVAPGVTYALPHLIQSTGYPVTVSLAGFFKVFGYGLYQARIFMLLWLIATLTLLFFLGRKVFGDRKAVLALLLVASFASFYGSGRTVVGEIPGFFFLLAGFYFILNRASYFWTGIFWGLAVVAKPSVFSLIIPTVFLTLLIERTDWISFLKKLCLVAVGMIPAGVLWILLVIPNPFASSTWISLWHFYSNPYSSSISNNVFHNISNIFHSTTLIYFGMLFLVIVLVRFWSSDLKVRFLYTFTLIYSFFAFIYYLRSPGWIRYILIAELLILFLLPDALSGVIQVIKSKFTVTRFSAEQLSTMIVVGLVVLQTVQMFTVADIFSSDAGLPVARYINETLPGKSVGLLNSLDVSVSINTPMRYNTFELTGMPVFGVNSILLPEPPDVIVSYPGEKYGQEGALILEKKYTLRTTIDGYSIYVKKILK